MKNKQNKANKESFKIKSAWNSYICYLEKILSMHKLFENLKVLDLSTVLAGPSVATYFAELGAEVLKIEPQVGCDKVLEDSK